MSDFGGLGDSWLLSEQLAMYRTLDSMERNRSDRTLTADLLLAKQRAAQMVDRYNQLVRDHNTLVGKARQDHEQQAATIAAAKKANQDLQAECERLRLKLLDVTSELALLRAIDKQNNPDAYLSD